MTEERAMTRQFKLMIIGILAAAFVLVLDYGAEAQFADAAADTTTAAGDTQSDALRIPKHHRIAGDWRGKSGHSHRTFRP